MAKLASKTKKKPPAGKDKVAGKRDRVSAEALPRRALEEALRVAEVLHRTYAGSAKGDDIAAGLELKPTGNQFRYLMWSAQGYGLITKSEEGQSFSLSETGRKIVAATFDGEEREGMLKALLTPTVLSQFFVEYNGHPVPSSAHFPNVLETKFHIPRARTAEAGEIILKNARYAGILRDSPEHDEPVVDLEGPRAPDAAPVREPMEAELTPVEDLAAPEVVVLPEVDWERVCFFIVPIGEEGTEVRRHADMMLKHLVKPIGEELGLHVVRADGIERSGLITKQILDHLARARVCVADLSFGNANAFYELGVRHAFKLPTIQVIRKGDRIPFDVSQGRTIGVDTSDVYTVTDRLESARRELSEHMKALLERSEAGEHNPVHVYLPGLKVTIGG